MGPDPLRPIQVARLCENLDKAIDASIEEHGRPPAKLMVNRNALDLVTWAEQSSVQYRGVPIEESALLLGMQVQARYAAAEALGPVRQQEHAPRDPCLAKLHDGEPIFVLRAQDAIAPEIVKRWAEKALKWATEGVGLVKADVLDVLVARERKAAAAFGVVQRMLEWQIAHPGLVKLPD